MTDNWERALPPKLRQRLRVLLVDDHQFVRHIVTQILNSAEIRDVVHASSGAEAVRVMETGGTSDASELAERLLKDRPDIASDLKISKSSVDCIISDFRMEPVNGLDLLKMVRDGSLGARRDLPFMLLTGHTEDFVIAAALELDVDAFVVKPVSRENLLSRLARVLATRNPIKDADVYAAVSVPPVEGERRPHIDVTGPLIKRTVAQERADQAAELRKRTRMPRAQVSIEKLTKGMVVAKDVVGPSGSVLLREGTTLSALALTRFRDLVEMEDLEGSVWVYKQ